MSIIKVSAIQFPLQENVELNDLLKKIEQFIDKSKGCDLIVFPELLTTEIIPTSETSYHEQLKEHARSFTPMYLKWLSAQAVSKKINILGGTVPRLVKNKIYNTAVLCLTNGDTLLQDKIYLTPDEKEWGLTPGNTLTVFDTKIGKLVITTCFDSEIPKISNLLVSERPELLLIPSWTSTPSGLNRVEWSARARAIEHYAYVVKTGTVPGAHMTDLFGQASIIGPQETGFSTEIIHGPLNKPAVVQGEIDLSLLRSMRKKSGYYPANEQLLRTKSIKIT